MFSLRCLQLLLVLVLLSFDNVVFAGQEQNRDRLEELFIWKVSEVLKLESETELKFSQQIRELNQRRRAAAEKLDALVLELARGEKAKTTILLKDYRLALDLYHKIQREEIEQLNKLLGQERFAKYLVVKNEMTEKLKALLSAPSDASKGLKRSSFPEAESNPSTPEKKAADVELSPPKIIEEK